MVLASGDRFVRVCLGARYSDPGIMRSDYTLWPFLQVYLFQLQLRHQCPRTGWMGPTMRVYVSVNGQRLAGIVKFHLLTD